MTLAFQTFGFLVSLVFIVFIILSGLYLFEIIEEKTESFNVEVAAFFGFVVVFLFSPYVVFSLMLPIFGLC